MLGSNSNMGLLGTINPGIWIEELSLDSLLRILSSHPH